MAQFGQDIDDRHRKRRAVAPSTSKDLNRRYATPSLPSMSRRIRILIADDSPLVLKMQAKIVTDVLNMFEVKDYVQVDTACDGEQALAKIDELSHQGEEYALVLLDVFMPNLTGVQVAVRTRLSAYHGSTMPLVACTASDDIEDWTKGYESEEECLPIEIFDDAILKPVNLNALIPIMACWVLPRLISINSESPISALRAQMGDAAFRGLSQGGLRGIVAHMQRNSTQKVTPPLAPRRLGTHPGTNGAREPNSGRPCIIIASNSTLEKKLLKKQLEQALDHFELGDEGVEFLMLPNCPRRLMNELHGVDMTDHHSVPDDVETERGTASGLGGTSPKEREEAECSTEGAAEERRAAGWAGSESGGGGLNHLMVIIDTNCDERQAFDTIRALNSETSCSIPIVLITTRNDEALMGGTMPGTVDTSVGDAVVKYCADVILKPFSLGKIQSTVGQWILPQLKSGDETRNIANSLSRSGSTRLSQGAVKGLINYQSMVRHQGSPAAAEDSYRQLQG